MDGQTDPKCRKTSFLKPLNLEKQVFEAFLILRFKYFFICSLTTKKLRYQLSIAVNVVK